MDIETRKIAGACFVGGILCAAVALCFAPAYWWFGLIAGFAGGYVSYEFKEVLRAIPVVLRNASEDAWETWERMVAFYKTAVEIGNEWFSKPHYFAYPATVAVIPLFPWLMYSLVLEIIRNSVQLPLLARTILLSAHYVAGMLAFVYLATIGTGLLFAFAFIGARRGERCYWLPFVSAGTDDSAYTLEEARKLGEKGYEEKPLTYGNVLRWAMLGLGLIALLPIYTMWKYLAIGAWAMLRFLGRFAWHLFRTIHSEKRVLCALDGTIGGATSYFVFTLPAMPLGAAVVVVFFGGLIGAAFGVLNYEVVSKRILGVADCSA